jgi:hypothetical protein
MWELGRHARVDLKSSLLVPLLLSLAVSLPIQFFKSCLPVTVMSAFGLAGAGLLAYFLLLISLQGKTLFAEGKFFLQAVLKRP